APALSYEPRPACAFLPRAFSALQASSALRVFSFLPAASALRASFVLPASSVQLTSFAQQASSVQRPSFAPPGAFLRPAVSARLVCAARPASLPLRYAAVPVLPGVVCLPGAAWPLPDPDEVARAWVQALVRAAAPSCPLASRR